jgi:hypothetical protein
MQYVLLLLLMYFSIVTNIDYDSYILPFLLPRPPRPGGLRPSTTTTALAVIGIFVVFDTAIGLIQESVHALDYEWSKKKAAENNDEEETKLGLDLGELGRVVKRKER